MDAIHIGYAPCAAHGSVGTVGTMGTHTTEHGKMTFSHALAAPTFVAVAIDQAVADFVL